MLVRFGEAVVVVSLEFVELSFGGFNLSCLFVLVGHFGLSAQWSCAWQFAHTVWVQVSGRCWAIWHVSQWSACSDSGPGLPHLRHLCTLAGQSLVGCDSRQHFLHCVGLSLSFHRWVFTGAPNMKKGPLRMTGAISLLGSLKQNAILDALLFLLSCGSIQSGGCVISASLRMGLVRNASSRSCLEWGLFV